MRARLFVRLFLLFSLFMGAAILWSVLAASPASAQCENPPTSSCFSCHAKVDHLAGMGEWNKVHMKQEMCTSCHGGNGSTIDEAMAHADMVPQPLSDIYTDCHSCHPLDYTEKSKQLAASLKVTPGSCATPTPVPVSDAFGGPPAGINPISVRPLGKIPAANYFALILGVLAGLVLFMLGLTWLDKHHVEG